MNRHEIESRVKRLKEQRNTLADEIAELEFQLKTAPIIPEEPQEAAIAFQMRYNTRREPYFYYAARDNLSGLWSLSGARTGIQAVTWSYLMKHIQGLGGEIVGDAIHVFGLTHKLTLTKDAI
jgi:hypothetical protein